MGNPMISPLYGEIFTNSHSRHNTLRRGFRVGGEKILAFLQNPFGSSTFIPKIGNPSEIIRFVGTEYSPTFKTFSERR
tara:strand:- start:231 stop:464 length:234 start_codon:yes stop_codon:yes gene_type:complete